MPLIAVDTNVFVYASGLRRVDADEAKIAIAGPLIAELAIAAKLSIAAQVFAELHRVLIRKMRLSAVDADIVVNEYIDAADVVATTGALLADAFRLVARHNLQTYDAIILAAAAASRCDILYSEDMQSGFVWRGVEVVNPFTA